MTHDVGISRVVGLGNFGAKYAQTRHNIAWLILVALESRGAFGGERRKTLYGIREGVVEGITLMTVRPYTYMNSSGDGVRAMLRDTRSNLDSVVIVHDDLDLPFGRLRIRKGGSSGGQRGVQSLIERLGTKEFIRLRVGIGRPPSGMDPVDYVLHTFTEAEWQQIPSVLERAADGILALARDGLETAMNHFNRDVRQEV